MKQTKDLLIMKKNLQQQIEEIKADLQKVTKEQVKITVKVPQYVGNTQKIESKIHH